MAQQHHVWPLQNPKVGCKELLYACLVRLLRPPTSFTVQDSHATVQTNFEMALSFKSRLPCTMEDNCFSRADRPINSPGKFLEGHWELGAI